MTGERVRVTSEVGRLERVICHTPGPELLAVTPTTKEDFLYDDLLDLEEARREHRRFRAVLSRFAEVHSVSDLLGDIIEMPEARSFLVERVLDVTHSEPLGRMVKGRPGSELARKFIEGEPVEQGLLARVLNVESYGLPPLPNLFFTRDAGMVVGESVIVGSMRYTVRWTEETLVKALFTFHPRLQNAGILYDGSEERRSGYTLEGGDVHVLREDTVLIGVSQRSSPEAFDAVAEALARGHQVKHILVVVLPPERAMIHLDMVFTMVDRTHAVVYPPAFVGPGRYPVLYHRVGEATGLREMPDLFAALREVDLPVEPIFCGGPRRMTQEREQWSSGCNFVAVRPGLVVGYARNEHTYEAMEREAGFRVVTAHDFLTGEDTIDPDERAAITFAGAELVRGGGGGRCMTLPVARADAW